MQDALGGTGVESLARVDRIELKNLSGRWAMSEPRIDALAQDLRFAGRSLRRAPGLSALVVLSLALGIGANTAIFSVAREVLFKPIPYRDAHRVVLVELYVRDAPIRMTERQAADIQRFANSLERVEASSTHQFAWRRGDSAVRLLGRIVTPDLPSAMDMIPLLGRAFRADEGNPGSEPVVLISEGLWRREFGSAPDVVGRTLMLDDVRRTVVGVSRAPASDRDVDVWVPRGIDRAGDWHPSVIAWLRPGVSLEQAKAELDSLSATLVSDGGGLIEIQLSRPGDEERGSSIYQTILIFWGASTFVLAIVGANLASLLLARNLTRRRDIAIQAALGASRVGIVRRLLAESLLLGVLGSVGAVLVAMWGTALLLALRPPSLVYVYPDHVTLDATVIGYSLALSLLTAVMIGAAPALRVARTDLLRNLNRDDPRGAPAGFGRWLFRSAVGLQTALALVLLVGAGLMISSFVHLKGVGPGFEPDHVVEMLVELDPAVYVDPGTRRDFFHRLAEAVGDLPGVVEASVAADVPPHNGIMFGAIDLEDRPSEPLRTVGASWAHVAPNYFRVLRVPHLEGRTLTDHDAQHHQVVVSRSFGRKFWPQASAVGQRFRLRREGDWGPWMHIVGVVGDVTGRGLRDTSDEIYLPYAADRAERGVILARVEREPSRLFQTMKEQVWALNPDLPITRVGTLRDRLASSIDEESFYARLLGTFAFIALILAVIGVFGVTSYAANQRTREIAIRIALGAHGRDVERLVVLQGFVPLLLGIVAGLSGALALGRMMSSVVYGVSVTNTTIYLAAAMTLAAASLVATWVPARRASRVDPILVLRNE
ncbi:MAG: FtsX-like permease family protein [Luteitalea sp.]|nr:FtsX-like permease family protein [Luteitalea sp.]